MIIYKIKNPNCEVRNSEIEIGFDTKIKVGGSVNQYKNFEYIPQKTCLTNKGELKLHILRFKNIDSERKKIIFAILESIEKFDDNKTIVDILEMFSDYFSKNDEDFLVNKLLGDIGEACFILTLQKNKIDYSKYYQHTEKSLYDFNFNNHFVDIKTTSSARKNIYLNWRQISIAKNVSFFVCEVNKVQNNDNIIDLLEKIKNKNDIIKAKIEFWKKKNLKYSNIIDSYTVDPKNVVAYFVDKKTIPTVKIINNGGLIDMIFKISVASAKKIDFCSYMKNLLL